MVVEDVQFMNYLKGKRIKLVLKNTSFLGVVQRINANKTLVLADVVSGSNGGKLPGSKVFFGHEILNVEFINEANNSGNAEDDKLEEHLNVEKFQPYRKIITSDDDEDDEEYINFVVIDEFHEKFGPAVMNIKKQHVIGLGADGVEVFKHGRLCWLQIAIKNKVYLFDILLLGARAFKNGLSMILENKHILKVIHDCRAISACLITQFGVKLNNVFDTQVADVMCFHSETGGFLPDRVSTLQEVVSLHLKVPSSQLKSLQMKSQLTMEEKEMWQKRPCPLPLLKVMALSVIHLQPLRLVLLDTLMTDFVTLVASYLNSSCYEPDELEDVSMDSVLELPRELRQLEQMQHDRHAWASSHYPVTDQGLLARFSPLPQTPPSHTPPAAEEQRQVQADSPEPAPSPKQADPPPHTPKPSPLMLPGVSSVKVCAPAEVQAQVPDPAAVSHLHKVATVNSPLSVGVGRGRAEALLDSLGRGRLFGDEQPPVPVLGRGLLLQMSQACIPRARAAITDAPGRMGSAPSGHEVTPDPGPGANDPPKNPSDSRGDSFMPPPPFSLQQSFRAFRY